MATPRPFDPLRLFLTLQEHDVRFVVIGGLAAAASGAGWSTFDADVVVAADDDNLSRLQRALQALDAEYDTPHTPPIRPDIQRLRNLQGPQLFRTRFGRLDVLKDAGGERFDTLLPDAIEVEIGGTGIRYAGLHALLRMKRAANRPKDAEGIRLIEQALRKPLDDND